MTKTKAGTGAKAGAGTGTEGCGEANFCGNLLGITIRVNGFRARRSVVI